MMAQAAGRVPTSPETVVLIDLPEAVDAVTNPAGADLPYRDIENAATGFGGAASRPILSDSSRGS